MAFWKTGNSHLETKKDRGDWGERQACRYLLKQGFKIIAQNVNYKVGEIDIVATEGETLCFVEVKSRFDSGFMSPELAVGYRKQKRLERAAQTYLKTKYRRPPMCRFDVISITGYGKGAKLEHFRNAFEVLV